MRLHTVQANVPAEIIGGHEVPIEDSPDGLVWDTQQSLLISDITQESRFPKVMALIARTAYAPSVQFH